MSERSAYIVTGANAGIGRAIALGLARERKRVVLACRDRRRGLAAATDIEERSGAAVELLLVDLACMASVREAADEALARFPRIEALVCNAAVWSVERMETAEGVERTWATNVLGHFALVRRLEARLAESAPARLVFVASGLAHSLELSDVELARRRYRGIDAYAQSKQAVRMLARVFARRLSGAEVAVNSVHPGFTRTDAFRSGGGVQGWIAGIGAGLFGQSPARAARMTIRLAADPALAGVTGRYFDGLHERRCQYEDPRAEDALFDLCERQLELVLKREPTRAAAA